MLHCAKSRVLRFNQYFSATVGLMNINVGLLSNKANKIQIIENATPPLISLAFILLLSGNRNNVFWFGTSCPFVSVGHRGTSDPSTHTLFRKFKTDKKKTRPPIPPKSWKVESEHSFLSMMRKEYTDVHMPFRLVEPYDGKDEPLSPLVKEECKDASCLCPEMEDTDELFEKDAHLEISPTSEIISKAAGKVPLVAEMVEFHSDLRWYYTGIR